MKRILLPILLFAACLVVWGSSDTGVFNRERYVDKKLLELATPFDVRIDTEFLKNLKPANE